MRRPCRQLAALQGESVKAFQWSPNGERILVISKWQHLALRESLSHCPVPALAMSAFSVCCVRMSDQARLGIKT